MKPFLLNKFILFASKCKYENISLESWLWFYSKPNEEEELQMM